MNQIGENGTPFMWSHYENTVLKNIYEAMQTYKFDNPELKNWLENIVRFDEDDWHVCLIWKRLHLHHYFHPLMKGRTSIKVVLPASIK